MGDFFTNLGDSLTGTIKQVTGQTSAANYSKSLDIQKQIADEALASETALNNLKYNPELSKQRTKQIALIVIPIVIVGGILFFFWIKNK